MRLLALALIVFCTFVSPSMAASLSKSYSYFPITGRTLAEIERQLQMRGPQLDSTGRRHPGATNMQFTTRVDYDQSRGHCRISDARVSVNAKIILPQWRERQRADRDVRLIWDTLVRDIKRHEESHLVIAKNHARLLEDSLKRLPRRRNCSVLAQDVERTSANVLAQHDRTQEEFDHVEAINFESRIMRLLEYRLEQIEAGRLKP